MTTQQPLQATPEALQAYINQCAEYCEKAKLILQEQEDPSSIAQMAREVIRLAKHLGQFEPTLNAAYVVTRDMAELLYEHPRLLLQLKETLKANIKAADEGRFGDIKTTSMLKSDPVEWTAEYEAVIDEADHEAYQHLKDSPRGMGFCFGYWAEKRNALARRGIEWKSPNILNPRVMFD